MRLEVLGHKQAYHKLLLLLLPIMLHQTAIYRNQCPNIIETMEGYAIIFPLWKDNYA